MKTMLLGKDAKNLSVSEIPVYVIPLHNSMHKELLVMSEMKASTIDGVQIEGVCALYDQEEKFFKFISKNRDDLIKLLNERDFIFEFVPEKQYRICSSCGKVMQVGYVFEGDNTYYCTVECRSMAVSEEEYLKMHDDGNGNAYWTSWHDC